MKPEVSVIIPAYNCEKTIERAIYSALNQINVDVELIIVNDCSTDETYRIINNVAKIDNRIKCFSNNRNLGVAGTRNIGCRYASGDYIAFLDSDDFWKPEKLDLQLKSIKKISADFCFSSYSIISQENDATAIEYRVPETITYQSLLKENVIGCSTVVIKSLVMQKYSFNVNFFHEDYVLWLELLRTGSVAVGIKKPLVYYTKGGRSANKFKAAKNRWDIYRQIEKLPLLLAIYYFACYAWNGIKKHSEVGSIHDSNIDGYL